MAFKWMGRVKVSNREYQWLHNMVTLLAQFFFKKVYVNDLKVYGTNIFIKSTNETKVEINGSKDMLHVQL